jgi:4-diphosphocytidyl-2-C-methyl-D-erythritol kinase
MSFSVLTFQAPAKINIGLRVFPRRPDGFHNLVSIFQAVGLWDTLTVRLDAERPRECTVVCDGEALPGDNTLQRAYDSFRAFTGESAGVRVTLHKAIPVAAGLGGGSSDGAALIRALDALSDARLSLDSLDKIAASVGSEVFFFLHCPSGAAMVSGRGEKVVPLQGRSDLNFVLICPPVYSSTVEAYELLDQSRSGFDRNGGRKQLVSLPPHPLLSEWAPVYSGDTKDWNFVNDFMDCIAVKYPLIRDAERDLTRHGSVFTSLTGSGSAVYGLFASQLQAEEAACELADRWQNCYAVSAV